jgi:hypothetical protein
LTFPASAIDKVDGSVPVECSRPPSGSIFSVNTTTTLVFCSAIDTSGNEAIKQFDVTVTQPTCAVENQDYYPIEGCVPDSSNCSDNLDNDNDGLIDANDPDCYPPCPPGTAPDPDNPGECVPIIVPALPPLECPPGTAPDVDEGTCAPIPGGAEGEEEVVDEEGGEEEVDEEVVVDEEGEV